MSSNEQQIKEEFKKIGYGWNDKMRGMFGKCFQIRKVVSDKIIKLTSPDGSGTGGTWYFPTSIVSACQGKLKKIIQHIR